MKNVELGQIVGIWLLCPTFILLALIGGSWATIDYLRGEIE